MTKVLKRSVVFAALCILTCLASQSDAYVWSTGAKCTTQTCQQIPNMFLNNNCTCNFNGDATAISRCEGNRGTDCGIPDPTKTTTCNGKCNGNLVACQYSWSICDQTRQTPP
jgi:hypothetical protein